MLSLLFIPAVTLFLATSSSSHRARRRRKLAPPDFRYMDLMDHASDLAIEGLDDNLVEWIVSVGERAGVPPMLGSDDVRRMEKSLRAVQGAKLSVTPEEGWWSVRQGPWLIQTEPWCSECLIGRPDPIPGFTGERIKFYRAEAARRRRTPPHEGVPPDAEVLLTEMWLPAAPLKPNPLGLDYDVVQLTVWRMKD